MKAAAAMLAALALSGPLLAQPQLDPEGYRAVPLRPVALAEAVAQFERICLATGFDPKAFEAAIVRSEWEFNRKPGAGTPAPDVRLAREGVINFHSPPSQEERAFVPGQCNMEAVLRPAEGRPAVLEALEGALRRALGTVPAQHDFPGESCWRSNPPGDWIYRLCIIYRPNLVAGHVAWSYQRWTPRGEQRAGLAPPMDALTR